MAITRRTLSFLPVVFQTGTNEKFLSATMDQLVSEPTLTSLYGYIGRKFAPTYQAGDSYVIESSASRQDYQLEPSIVIHNNQNDVTFLSTYPDFLNQIAYYGGFTDDQSRLFEQEYYSFDPLISYDKFVNFSQYYWLPNGPPPVEVNTSGIPLSITYNVTRDTSTNQYIFSNGGIVDNSIILARGGVYSFVVNQPGFPFWIQSSLGTSGTVPSTETISNRDVLGVTNNGAEVGVITFAVPQSNAQDRFLSMPTVSTSIDYATPTPYSDWQNKTVSQFQAIYPQYAGITGSLNGKYLIFYNQQNLNNVGEAAWTNPVVHDNSGNVVVGYNAGYVVPAAPYGNVAATPRYGIWQVVTVDAGIKNLATGANDPLIQLIPIENVDINQKVYIRYGVMNANKEFYKDYDGFFKQIPVFTSQMNQLFIQDGNVSAINATIKVIDYTGWSIDVETDIIGQQKYTSPNGVEFTSGLKIQFGTDVTPASYQNNQYYVEQVGNQGTGSSSGIRLVPVATLVTPEKYNVNNSLNYPTNQVILDVTTTDNIPAGAVIHVGNTIITTSQPTSAGSHVISTLSYVGNITYGESVSGNGIASGTMVYDAYAQTVFPEYITINRSSIDGNPWSRNNRWFHQEVIIASANYNNQSVYLDQNLRAKRPIIQFDADIQMWNSGRVAKLPIDILDTTITDAFTQLNGQILSTAFGISLFDTAGNPLTLRVIFGADQDPLVKDKIYVLTSTQYAVNNEGLPTGPYRINLVEAADGEILVNDTVAVMRGIYAGSQWWYTGSKWTESQPKTASIQAPLFDVYQSTLNLDPTSNNFFYPVVGQSLSQFGGGSTFAGTQIFGYKINSAGVDDTVLGFPLSYKSFSTQGDIEFQNFFNTDTFTYGSGINIVTESVNLGFLQKINDRYTTTPTNTWKRVVENSKQYQLIGYVYDGTSNIFPIDIIPNTQSSIPYLKVFLNFKYLDNSQWVMISNQIRLTASQTFIGDGVTVAYSLNAASTATGVLVLINGSPIASTLYGVVDEIITFQTAPLYGDKIDIRIIQNPNVGDKVDILVYSDQISQLGYYQVPLNLDLNAQNIDINTLTLGQMRNHLVALAQNSTVVTGVVLGSSNLRDVDIKGQGGTLLQHSAPVPYAELFLTDPQANLVEALRYAQREYARFKNKFLELSGSLSGIDPTDPVMSVDLILTQINSIKNSTFPWYYSDMIPYGTNVNVVNSASDPLGYRVYDPTQTEYELTTLFTGNQLSNQAVLVYYITPNGEVTQLIKGLDFLFLSTRPAIQLTGAQFMPVAGSHIKIVEYLDTNGCYVPETPSKLGLWPQYIPAIIAEDPAYQPDPYTGMSPMTIRGHDGSITQAFGDYRDAFLYELELRIYNNIKLPDFGTYGDVLSTIPGKYRKTGYSISELTALASKNFQNWVGNNSLDFTTNSTFEPNNAFTWNYGSAYDPDGESLTGSWRAVYQYYYDTFRPNLTPWEMLGFATMPEWWEKYYGPGPYTGGNELLWQDLEAGIIREGPRAPYDVHYQRPGLTKVIPVDENGNLKPPGAFLAQGFSTSKAAESWLPGQYGPVEFAWRTSSEFPYAVQQALCVAKPAKFFGTLIDTYNYSYLNALYLQNTATKQRQYGQYLTTYDNHHLTQMNIHFNGETLSDGTIYRGAGYLNYIADYLTSQGVVPETKITNLLTNYQVNLAYKAAGFTDQKYLNILAEQNSPASTNNSIVIPNQNYKVYLNKSTPTQTITYSAVIVEKSNNGYKVKGYDLNNPYFTIIPSIANSNASKVNVLNSTASIYNNYQPIKLTVPYGFEFASQQQLVDFLISYERFLLGQGFTFQELNPNLNEIGNWTLSAQEFLYWAQQGWATGSIIVLSPVANRLNVVSITSTVDGISDTQYGSRIVDQNFKLVKNVNYQVTRSSGNFSITLTDPAAVIGFVKLDLVQYEHALIFDNVDVFNDVIYQPETGNRQFRLKLIGQRTANWDGSLYAPGFIYWDGAVDTWNPGKDYLQGDLVQYKNQKYTALQDVIAHPTFQFQYWSVLTSSQLQTGLLPNFSTIAAQSKSYYTDYPSIDNLGLIEYSHGLIGYRNRQYLADLGLTETTQVEFYKGYITQKGTLNAINQLITAQFNNLTSNISLYEEWAIRVGEYGALASNPYVEVPLAESSFGSNPSVLQFVSAAENNQADGITIFNQQQLYKSEGTYTGNIALVRTENSDYNNDIPKAGYVNINDITQTATTGTTLYDIHDYAKLNSIINNVGTGYRIWVALDFNRQWNVYRISETNNHVLNIAVNTGTTNHINLTFEKPHKLTVNQVFVAKEFYYNDNGVETALTALDGFYQVSAIVNDNTVSVLYTGSTASLPVTGKGIFFTLNSSRFVYMEDTRIYGLTNPLNGWKVGDKVWIDDDAATTAIQGQPYNTVSGTWKVYERQRPWAYDQQLIKSSVEYTTGDGFGTSTKMSLDNSIIVTGSPYSVTGSGNTGSVSTFLRNYAGTFVEAATVIPTAANTAGFGYSLDLGQDADYNATLTVGAPQSLGNVGYVYIYDKRANDSVFSPAQVLIGNVSAATPDQFGFSVAFNQDATWMHVGAPGNDKVYVYGWNGFIPYKTQTISVNNLNILALSGNLQVNVGDVITQQITGAQAFVNTQANSTANLQVSTLTNFLPRVSLASLTLNYSITANIGDYVTQVSSGANILVYQPSSVSTNVVGLSQRSFLFDTVGNIAINGVPVVISTFAANSWSNVGVRPTFVGTGNIVLNGQDTGLYLISTNTQAVTSNISLNFTPAVANDATSLLVTGVKTYIPNIDYVVSGGKINFINSGNISSPQAIAQSTITVNQRPYYVLLTTLQGNAGSKFGYALASSADGAQMAVGAPNDGVIGAAGNVLPGAGTVTVYDRVIEAFNSNGGTDYITKNPIAAVYRVTVDNAEVNNYLVVGTNTIRFTTPIDVGHVIFVEVNLFNVLEQLIGVNSLTGGLSQIQANANFGTSLTICSNNCAIYVGAPYYSAGTEYSAGAVWKFHNRGRLYGTNTGYTLNPVFTPGDSIHLNNFEVVLQPRMMPTTIKGTAANILSLSSNVSANVGQVISQNLGNGYYANVTVLANVKQAKFVTVTNYTTANVFNYGQSLAGANVVSVNGNITSAYPMVSIDSLVQDINAAQILGVTAVNQQGYLRLNSDITIAKDELRIVSGVVTPRSPGVYSAADLRIFAYMQIIINPYGASNEYFGSKVKLAQNAYMLVIGSARGTTREFTTFDVNSTILPGMTTFDQDSTRFTNIVQSSGSTYIYELYDDPRNAVEHPGRYQYCQQLDPGDLVPGEQFGYALDIEGTYIVVTAPSYTVAGAPTGSGTVYVFLNPTLARGWNLIRYQQPTVDVDSLSRCYLYSNLDSTIKDSLQFFDPVKGRILGQAAEEISYQTEYDPAVYNRGSNANADINANIYWGTAQVGQVWWDLDKVRFIDYEQDTLQYRSLNWGSLFPGCKIVICEWVESTVLPSKYAGDGTPLYADNSAYVEITYVDPVTGIIGSKYYFWVTGKTTVPPNDPTRVLPIATVADYIQNPINQGIPFAAAISTQALAFYNIAKDLSASNTIMHVDYQLMINTQIIHSEYELLQKGNPNSRIPQRIGNVLIDSLSGISSLGAVVPDPLLSTANRYGIDIRPRQSMFVDRMAAVREMVTFVNSVFIKYPLADQYQLQSLYSTNIFGVSAEPIPVVQLGLYDLTVEMYQDLAYIDTTTIDPGYRVLVTADETQDGLWVIYQWTSIALWLPYRVQAYKTDLYWQATDWYADGYSSKTQATFTVATTNDAKALQATAGSIIYILNAAGNGTWALVVVQADGSFTPVGLQNGTVQLDSKLGDFAGNNLGFGNQGFNTGRFDQNPNIELRYIVSALKNDIFINALKGKFNELFFILVNYVFTEQKYVDWIFKSSFISVTHNLRTLAQFPSYIQDNQTYYQSYIDEVKPFRTKIREYLITYTGDDLYSANMTDFDLPPYYATNPATGLGIFRSPSGEAPYIDLDEAKWQTYPYNQWYENRFFQVEAVMLEDVGMGYTSVPTVSIVSVNGYGSGATAVAYIDGNTGAVTRIEVTNPGSGYTATPKVVVNGNGTMQATAYAVIINPLVRSFNTTLKFDRITFGTNIQYWQANTAYTAGQLVSYAQPDVDVNGNSILTRKTYQVIANIANSGNNFISNDFTVYTANLFNNANDRIVGYYQPNSSMPAVETISVLLTNANAAVNTNTVYVFPVDNIIMGMTISGSGLPAGDITGIVGNVAINFNGVDITCTQLTLSVKVNLPVEGTTFTGTYISTEQLVQGIGYPNPPVTGVDFKLSPLFGEGFDLTTYDGIQYSVDGIPLLSTSVVDSILQSNYGDQALGLNPGEITTSGGGYVDPYHSHAPEEFVPGITFDTLDMRVYTELSSIGNTTPVAGYRIFTNMLNQTSYLRISQAYSSRLARELTISDTTIWLTSSGNLMVPDTGTIYSGVVWIGSERITYWTVTTFNPVPWTANTVYPVTASSAVSYANVNYQVTGNVYGASFTSNSVQANVTVLPSLYSLGTIRRSTQGTAGANVWPTGTQVFDAGLNQVIPNTVANTTTTTSNTSYKVTDTVSYKLRLSAPITANIGSYITQATSGANVTLLAFDDGVGNVLVSYNSGAFNYLGNTVVVAGNIAINGVYTGNTYPISSVIQGYNGVFGTITAGGNATVLANTTLQTANTWYNLGANSATNGQGFQGATTGPVLFLKASPAYYGNTIIGTTNPLTTETAINIDTEDGNDIYTET